MNFRMFGLIVSALCCVACSTNKYGIYDVVYKSEMDNFTVCLFKSDTHHAVRFHVDYKGYGICEAEVDPVESRTVLSPYPSNNDLDNVTVRYYDGKIHIVNRITVGTNTFYLFDIDGDGYPEKRITYQEGGDSMLFEHLAPQVLSHELKTKDKKGNQGHQGSAPGVGPLDDDKTKKDATP